MLFNDTTHISTIVKNRTVNASKVEAIRLISRRTLNANPTQYSSLLIPFKPIAELPRTLGDIKGVYMGKSGVD